MGIRNFPEILLAKEFLPRRRRARISWQETCLCYREEMTFERELCCYRVIYWESICARVYLTGAPNHKIHTTPENTHLLHTPPI